jgi:hypothetical protein
MAGKIVVSRKRERINRRRSYKIIIDGKEVGAVKNESAEEFEVEVGIHHVQSKIDWCSSPSVEVDVKEGKNSYIIVKSGMKYYLPLLILALVGVLFPMYFKLAQLPRPEWTNIVKVVLIGAAMLYVLYYLTINRKRYLLIEDDTNNPFK